ncbi:glycosyltransferase family 39 protein [Paludisphaera rhizosphaerae]|uniref:glycosyltransferase family 39 protein n=1 Tax=Paludisphaera rhizosphaerae TaxID=2711216 RepID=UPI0013EA9DFC|nr:glycosyltransferase family 39 protein [Paludisphaera rhizosphaerae]
MPIRDAFSRQIDTTPLLNWLHDLITHRPLDVCVWLGAALRVWVFSQGRSYWMDEGSLLGNIRGKAPFDFSGPLTSDQLAPPGFLAVERILVMLLGGSPYVTRLIPLACGIGALFLFRRLVERLLTPPAALVAMFLFAFGDDLVYYSNELKPYASDLAIGLLITILSLREVNEPSTPRRRLALAILVIVSPWFSFPSVFVTAGCGIVLLATRLRSGRRDEARALAAMAAAWAVSAFAAHRLASGLLGAATSMYVFWNFAFPPMPPRSLADLATTANILLETFVTPLNLVPRFLPYAFALMALVFAGWGMRRLAARDAAAFWMLALPVMLAIGASIVRRYPFHGRLILWTVPLFFALIAEGVQEIRYRRGKAWYRAALAFLMLYPTVSTLYEAIPPHYRDFNPHGDLRRNRFID